MRLEKGKVIFPASFPGGVFALLDLSKDFDSILRKRDEREIGKIRAMFERQIDFLERNGQNAIQHGAWFERLRHQDEAYYAMRIVLIANIRIIYTFLGSKPVLLYAFSEKARGNAKANSYSAACDIAKRRLADFLKGEEGQCVTIVDYKMRT